MTSPAEPALQDTGQQEHIKLLKTYGFNENEIALIERAFASHRKQLKEQHHDQGFKFGVKITRQNMAADLLEALQTIKHERPESGPQRNGTAEAVRKAYNRGVAEAMAIVNNELNGEGL